MNNSNELLGQMCLEDLFGPAFSDGRTLQVPYQAEPKRVQTLEKSYHPLSASSKKSTPIFLYLRGGWHNAGLLDGDGWQVAWRILDSQYVGGGTAKRRRRLFVIADFGGHRAGEILFKPASVPWNYSAVMQAWKDTSRSLDERIAEASRIIGCRTRSDEKRKRDVLPMTSPRLYFENHPTDSRVTGPCDIAKTVAARYGTGGGNTPLILNILATR